MQTVAEIKALLEEQGVRPKHAMGQNYLIKHDLIRRIVDRSGVEAGDTVLEIGPGTGTMTEELVERGCRVVCSELDKDMASIIERRLGEHVEVVRGDCLANKREINPSVLEALGPGPFKLVANLPYGAASPVMVALAADHADACRGQYVTIQREAGQRLRALPRTKEYAELGIVVQAMCAVERIATLPPGCFWPAPKVTSEMVAIEPLAEPLTADPRRLAELCRALFTKRRKQIGTILGRDCALPTGVEHEMRPEELTVEQLVALAELRGGAGAT